MGATDMWTDLVQAYESKLAVLEEARAAYSKAVVDVIGHVGPAMEAAVREGLGDTVAEYRVEAAIVASGGNASFASAPWSCITIADDSAGTEFRVAAWIASSWGGPEGMLRVALSLERVHSGLDVKEWVAKCGDFIAESAPGESFDPLAWQKFADTSPDWLTIRIASIGLVNRDFREVAKEARDAAQAFAESFVPLFELIRDAGLPMTNAESALIRYRPVLEARAQRAGVSWGPAKGLGAWQGGKYLQVGQFWLATDPARNQLIAVCGKEDHDVVAHLAAELGHPTGRQGSNLSVAILSEEDLRDPNRDLGAAVSAAFDFWFDTKANDLSASDVSEPPVD